MFTEQFHRYVPREAPKGTSPYKKAQNMHIARSEARK
jgi:hypothetical protein